MQNLTRVVGGSTTLAKESDAADGLIGASTARKKPARAARLRFATAQFGLLNEPHAGASFSHPLLTDARQELSRLLRDVRRAHQAGRSGTAGDSQSNGLLMRAVRCAAKQYALQAELRNLALKDELTGLHNRRGFYALSERQLKLACRSGRGILLFFIDLDGLKQINDSLGHWEGDGVLKRTAQVLKETFRDSDIMARLGGDEFAVLAIEASGHCEATIMARLQKYLRAANEGGARSRISLSVGIARFDHRKPVEIEDLITQADRAMYDQKWSRRSSTLGSGS